MKNEFNNLSGNSNLPPDNLSGIFNAASDPNHLILAKNGLAPTPKKKRQAPFSLRLSFNERQELEQRSEDAGISMGSY